LPYNGFCGYQISVLGLSLRLYYFVKMFLKNLLLVGLMTTVSAQSTVYLIRHGEKPSDGSNGLSAQGVDRAQCLRTVFGASSSYNIEYIIAEQPKSSTSSHSLPLPSLLILPQTHLTSLCSSMLNCVCDQD
jgi:hypothetical protein